MALTQQQKDETDAKLAAIVSLWGDWQKLKTDQSKLPATAPGEVDIVDKESGEAIFSYSDPTNIQAGIDGLQTYFEQQLEQVYIDLQDAYALP